jgi:hypothetical protein
MSWALAFALNLSKFLTFLAFNTPEVAQMHGITVTYGYSKMKSSFMESLSRIFCVKCIQSISSCYDLLPQLLWQLLFLLVYLDVMIKLGATEGTKDLKM